MSVDRVNRSKLANIVSYFDVSEEGSICLINNCSKKLISKQNTNLKRHVIAYHKEVAIQNKWISAAENSKSYSINISRNEIITNIIKLVTVDGCSFSLLNFESFRSLLEPIFHALSLKINSQNIQPYIMTTANFFKEKIQTEIKNKLVCLKVDSASRYNRAILGINLQFLDEDIMIIRTIGMVEITTSHTAENLKLVIIEILLRYGISVGQICSFTTDNGRNMLKAVSLINEIEEVEFHEHISNNEQEMDVTEEQFILTEHDWNIFSIKCAAHTLQLCINDALKNDDAISKISDIRKIVKELRKNFYRIEFTKNKKRIPVLDVVTRWSSTFNMLDSIVDQSEFIKNILEIHDIRLCQKFNDILPFTRSLHRLLKPVAVATLGLQEQNLILGDLFKIWLELELEVDEYIEHDVINIKDGLLNAMNHRKANLFNNDIFLAAIYLDPRFNYLGSTFLTDEDKQKARVCMYRVS